MVANFQASETSWCFASTEVDVACFPSKVDKRYMVTPPKIYLLRPFVCKCAWQDVHSAYFPLWQLHPFSHLHDQKSKDTQNNREKKKKNDLYNKKQQNNKKNKIKRKTKQKKKDSGETLAETCPWGFCFFLLFLLFCVFFVILFVFGYLVVFFSVFLFFSASKEEFLFGREKRLFVIYMIRKAKILKITETTRNNKKT